MFIISLIEQFLFEHQLHWGRFSKDIFVPIILIVSPEFSVMVKCSCPFGDCRISSEKIYVPCPHGSSNDMSKCDVFSIIRAAACSAFLMGGNRGNINDMTILFSWYKTAISCSNASCKTISEIWKFWRISFILSVSFQRMSLSYLWRETYLWHEGRSAFCNLC